MKTFVRIVAIMLIASVISTVSMVGTNSVAYVTGGGIYDVTKGTVLPNESSLDLDFAADEEVGIIVRLGDGMADVYASEDREEEFASFLTGNSAALKMRRLASVRENVKRMSKKAAPSLQIVSDYSAVFNGFSAKVNYGEIENILSVEGVVEIELDEAYCSIDDLESIIPTEDTAGDETNENACASDDSSATPSGTDALRINDNNIIDTSSLAQKGEGQVIAILDTGINYNHEAFNARAVNTETAKIKGADYYTSKLVSSLTIAKDDGFDAAGLFKNNKIVFSYDYADRDGDATLAVNSDHGLHVAGIAAGNNNKIGSSKFVGVAPSAQLMIFKIFEDKSEYTTVSIYSSAIEDAVKLGADVINLSIASSSQGFAKSSILDKTMAAATAAGVNVIAAAGNSGRASKNWYSSKMGISDLPDTATVGSPASAEDMMAVANFSADKKNSSSTSWGPNSELMLKPEIASLGSSVKSAIAGSTSAYGAKSGTSMASPSVAGHAAIMRQVVKERWPDLSGAELVKRINELLMCTATVCGSGAPYSPRVQGAGFANIRQAIRTTAYLSVDGCKKPKIELGDDPEKNGVYKFKFNVNNFGTDTVTYSLSAKASTELTYNGEMYYVDETLDKTVAIVSQSIKAVFESEGETITSVSVPGGESRTINVTLSLPSSEDEEINRLAAFRNGMFVEGFVYLTGSASVANLNIPFLGFYGDWNEASAFDYTIYDDCDGKLHDGALYAEFADKDNNVQLRALGKFAYPYDTVAYTDSQNKILSGDKKKLAINYSYQNNQTYNLSSLKYFKTALLRSVNTAYMQIEDADTGEVYWTAGKNDGVRKVARSYAKNAKNGLWTLSAPFTPGEFDCGGCTLPSGTVLSVKAKATSVYDNDFFGNEPDMKVTVDYEKPMLSSAKINGNNITLDVVDNHYVQAVKLYCLSNGNLVSANGNDFYTPVFGDGAGENASVDIPVSSFENTVRSSDDQKLYVCVIDYAFNESVFAIEDALTFTEKTFNYATSGGKYEAAADRYANYTKVAYDGATYANSGDGKLVLLSYGGSKESLTVKEGTTRIHEGAFASPSLKTVTLPSSLKRIGYNAFAKCPMLQKIEYDGDRAPTLEVPFSAFAVGDHPYPSLTSITIDKRNVADGFDFVAWQGVAFGERTWTSEFYSDGKLVSAQNGDMSQEAVPPEIEKEGYEFLGWFDDEGVKKETFFFGSGKAIAKWKAIYYDISFEVGEGSPVASAKFKFGDKIPSSVRKGYTLKWYDSEHGGSEVTFVPSRSCTLYARWTPIVSKVKINGEQEQKEFAYGDRVALSDVTPVKQAYVLLGLYKDYKFTEVAEDFDMPDADVVLYAKWIKEYVTVTYDAMNGENPDVIRYRYDEQRNLPVPKRRGYTFVGWFVDADCTISYDGSGEEDVTVYAAWEKNGLFDCATVNFGGLTFVGIFAVTMCGIAVVLQRRRGKVSANR